MPVVLSYCRITGNIIAVYDDDNVNLLATQKLASQSRLTAEEMKTVSKLRLQLSLSTRMAAGFDRSKSYLALRFLLKKDGRVLAHSEVINRLLEMKEVVWESGFDVSGQHSSPEGAWTISVGYAAIHESELVPRYVAQILQSLPYNFVSENDLVFDVVRFGSVSTPSGEWAGGRVDSDAMASSGRNNARDI